VERVAHSPLTGFEADTAFQHLERFNRLVLAVSGGPDSMALLALAADWRQRRGGSQPTISVATVDHQLRPESTSEAEFVAREATRLGVPHAILTWRGDKPSTGIPDAARRARYALLEEHALSFGSALTAVVTAHHLDDQAETFAMRLARGAGVDGLAAMPVERSLICGSDVTLVRPLLAFPKARLLATAQARKVPFVEDPTNEDLSYERVRMRTRLPELADIGLSAPALATSARRLGDAQAALQYAESCFVATLDLTYGNEVFAVFDRERFSDGPAFLRQKLLTRLIARYGGASREPQLSEIEALASRLQRAGQCTATLGGATVSAGRRFVRVWREAGRLDQGEIKLAPGESRVWDRRFLLQSALEGRGVTVKPLGAESFTKIVGLLSRSVRIPSRAAYALPSFWSGQELLAVPSLKPFALRPEPPLVTPGCELWVLGYSKAHSRTQL
jgi:tRNA(Ile)-lysidine synthase